MTPTRAADPKTVSLLRLSNPEPREEARIAMVSLPIPMGARVPPGIEGLATQGVDVGWWPDSRSGGKRVPRRRLVYALGNGPLPASCRLGKGASYRGPKSRVEAAITTIHPDYVSKFPHEVGELRFTSGNRSFGVRMGVRWRDEIHWWEWLRLETLWSGPLVTAYRVAGCIEIVPLTFENFIQSGETNPGRAIIKSPWLHNQDWLLGEIVALCFANGVVQLTCRHVNNHRFDEGREQTDTVPLIGFSVTGADAVDHTLDATQARFSLGGITLDLSDALALVSKEHPGSLKGEGDMILYQPYEGVEIEGDHSGRRRDDGFLVRASEKRIPKGVARSVRFGASLSGVDPAISRLTVPDWWYGVSGDLWPDGALPVHDAWDKRVNATFQVTAKDHRGRFDESVLGHAWEGECPYAEFLHYYRGGNPEHLRWAIRDAYHMADIAFDHSTETIRMHDYPLDGSIAPPLFRTMGMLMGYLETGDPYLLDCAESASSHWYWMDRHMWPRYAYGRDGASIRGLVFLWDYLGKEDYRAMARDAMGRLIQCQQADGSYRDQGSGTGIHGGSHMPVKPWMASLATDSIIDYLDRVGSDPDLEKSFMKYIGFIMKSAFQRDGKWWWPYQVRWGEATYDPWLEFRQPESKGILPGANTMTHGHKARALNVATRRTGDARYFDAWVRFCDGNWMVTEPGGDYHSFAKTLQHLPYAQAHAWNARWRNGALCISPVPSKERRELQGTISTPMGPVTLRLRQVHGKRGWKIAEKSGDPRVRLILQS